MSENKFEWNEELVKDAVNKLSKKFAYPNEHDKWEGINKELEKFKEQHTPVKDYEILSFTHAYEKYRLLHNGGGKYIRYNTELSAILSHVPKLATITAVKRLSDGEIFSIGDNLEGMNNENVIDAIWQNYGGNDIWLSTNAKEKCGVCLDGAKKEVDKPILTKPPLGIMPLYIHNEKRLKELNEAITRYVNANLHIPKEWFDERNTLIVYMKNRA